MPDTKKTIVEHFLSRSKQTLSYIPGYIGNGDWFTAVNRSYYAAFYAIKALELNDGYDDFSKHSAVISCFRQNYVKPGIVPKEFSYLIGTLSEDRTSGDYDMLSVFEKSNADECYNAAKQIVGKISELLK
ncbi:MAG: HEPN domain-containing protein [Clostridiales bacterium]|nr:HEPN domain-containing protein [Clostridiales bacterium]